MNLVAKEYVAAQDPNDPGVLVLSKFAGAANQLTGALLVNPHDADAMADQIDAALRMDITERRERWNLLWSAIEDRTPTLWGRSFVASLMRTTLPASRPAPRQLPAFAGTEVPAAPVPGTPHLTLVERDPAPQLPRRMN